MDERLCTVEGCENSVLAKELCSLHYQRSKKHGDPLYVYKRPKPSVIKCKVDGCENPSRAKNLCTNHYQQLLYQRCPTRQRLGRRLCAVDGCGKISHAEGLCDMHYMRQRVHDDIYHQRDPMPTTCNIDKCHEPYYAKGACKLHYGQERQKRKQSLRHGITEDQYIELLAKQGGKCAICRSAEPGGKGRWCIDHDHQCCPNGNGSCGKCIRGILCSSCNTGIGMFGDNVDILRAAIEYLAASTTF